MRQYVFMFLLFLVFFSCKLQKDGLSYTEVDTPKEIAERAYRFAELYESSETVYELGGQDPARTVIKIDCSGLVIMCYKYALVDTQYQLLETDMTANYMYQNASYHINKEKLRKGDLIFMGEIDSDSITHIALYDKSENGKIYFIDSTKKDKIDGVSHRFYYENDVRFKAFGIMRVKY